MSTVGRDRVPIPMPQGRWSGTKVTLLVLVLTFVFFCTACPLAAVFLDWLVD